MATKQSLNFTDPQHAEPHPYRDQSTEIILEIDGLTANSDGSFTLRGVKPFDFPPQLFAHIEDFLKDNGIAGSLAARLTEEAHDSIQTGLLADAIAQRTRRVA